MKKVKLSQKNKGRLIAILTEDYLFCPIRFPNNDNDIYCSSDCAWFNIDTMHFESGKKFSYIKCKGQDIAVLEDDKE